MKRWQLKHVMTLRRAEATTPKPFPGKYPTRIAWIVECNLPNGKRAKEEYIGRPSVNASQQFLHFAGQPDVFSSAFYEFDRAAIVGSSIWLSPITTLVYRNGSALTSYYHPFWLTSQVPGREKFYCHKVHGRWIYMSKPLLTPDDTRYYLNWLTERGLHGRAV